jgi:hypothetical protein
MKVEPSGHDHARTTSLESTAGGRRIRRVAEWPAEEPGALLGPVAGAVEAVIHVLTSRRQTPSRIIDRPLTSYQFL